MIWVVGQMSTDWEFLTTTESRVCLRLLTDKKKLYLHLPMETSLFYGKISKECRELGLLSSTSEEIIELVDTHSLLRSLVIIGFIDLTNA
jgi:hypothetical protein